jgi:dCMP deaminase
MMSANDRISWDDYAIKIAEVASLRSEDPYKKVGAAAFDKDHRLIGAAYNGLAPGKIVESKFWENRDNRRPFMIHAEQNLLSLFKRGECHTIACTLLPCSSCASMIAGYGIKRVLYKEEYERDQTAHDIFRFYGIFTSKLEDI